jgi:hypothetical protein
MDQIQAVIQIAEETWEYGVNIFHFFIYCEVVCDIINREKTIYVDSP